MIAEAIVPWVILPVFLSPGFIPKSTSKDRLLREIALRLQFSLILPGNRTGLAIVGRP